MTLKERLNADFKEAMKNKAERSARTLSALYELQSSSIEVDNQGGNRRC